MISFIQHKDMLTKDELVQLIKKERQRGVGGIYFWHHRLRDVHALDNEQQYETYISTIRVNGCKLVRVKQLTSEECSSLGILKGSLEIWQAQDKNGKSIDIGLGVDPIAAFCGFVNGSSEFTVLRINKRVKPF